MAAPPTLFLFATLAPSLSYHESLCWTGTQALRCIRSSDCFSTEGGRGGHRLRAGLIHSPGARLLGFLFIMLTSGGLRHALIEWDTLLILQMTAWLVAKTQAQSDLKVFREDPPLSCAPKCPGSCGQVVGDRKREVSKELWVSSTGWHDPIGEDGYSLHSWHFYPPSPPPGLYTSLTVTVLCLSPHFHAFRGYSCLLA